VRKILKDMSSDRKILICMQTILYCSIPPILLVVFVTIAMVLVNGRMYDSAYFIVFIQQTLPITLAYGVIPILIYKGIKQGSLSEIGIKASKYRIVDFINIAVLSIFTFLLINKGIFTHDVSIYVIHYFFVAVSEEILVRGLILKKLKEVISKEYIAIIISAVIFALVFHSTDGIFTNLLYRVPFGVITAYLYIKTDSMISPIILHWIYNVTITIQEVL